MKTQKRLIKYALILFLAFTAILALSKPSNSITEDKKEESGIPKQDLAAKIIADNSIIDKRISFQKSIDDTEDEVGLYVLENKYFFRGNVTNNYVSLNDDLWRIVSIDANMNVKLIKEEPLAEEYEYNHDDTSFKYQDSEISKELIKYYNQELLPFDEDIVIEEYCTAYDVNCMQENKQKIGILSGDEAIRAGYYPGINTENTYLAKDYEWWVVYATEYDSEIERNYVGYISSTNMLDVAFVDEAKMIRPVIVLKGTTKITGEGTIDDPYLVFK